jgi:RES domain
MTTFCPYCFDDKSLQNRLKQIRPNFPRTLKCDFHPNRSGLPARDVASLVDDVFRSNFVIGSVDPVYDRDDDKPSWVQGGDALVEIVEGITKSETFEIAEALTEQLIEDDPADPRDGDDPFYADDQSYALYDTSWNPHSETWLEFKAEITHNRRFFSELGVQRLQEIFRDIHFQSDFSGQRVIYPLSPEDKKLIYRVRQVDDPQERDEVRKNPGAQLGVPPPRKRSAGRMNATGVGVFYGSFDLKTCIAEVRPPVGSVIMGAAFELTRSVVVLDTTRFAKPMRNRSIFSPVYQERLHQWKFMKRFMNEISRPILPTETDLDYIPTQAVSEFINSRLKVPQNGSDVGIDGIIFASAQRPDGLNIALFGDAAVVERPQNEIEPTSFEAEVDGWSAVWTDWKPKPENPALRVADKSVVTRRVKGVDFRDEDHSEFVWDDED